MLMATAKTAVSVNSDPPELCNNFCVRCSGVLIQAIPRNLRRLIRRL